MVEILARRIGGYIGDVLSVVDCICKVVGDYISDAFRLNTKVELYRLEIHHAPYTMVYMMHDVLHLVSVY